jgi:hypothetical protein
MELTTFAIPAFRREAISARLEKLAKKARKNGNPDITVSFGNVFSRDVETEYGKMAIDYVSVSVSGEAPRIAGWDFLARIELLGGEENLVHRVPGTTKTLEERFRSHDGFCDHCNSARRRNDVFVLANDEKQIAVGRQCLREFLGIDDPKMIVARAQFFEDIKNMSDEDDLGNFGSYGFYGLREVLLLAAANIREHGYVSKARQLDTGYTTTGQVVAWGLSGVPAYQIEATEVDREWVEKTIGFFRRDNSFGNEYMDNIRVLVKQDIIKKEHVALISSAVITAQRELAPKAETKESNFVGEVKGRLKDISLLLEKIIFLGSGSFGPSYLHLLKDANGNAFSWITGNKVEVAEGTNITVDATVKDHKIYKGTKQTVLTRAKVKA